MSPESLKVIVSANTELSTFLKQVSAGGVGPGHPDDVLPEIESRLAAVTATIEKAGRAIGPLMLSENLDHESRAQLGLYTENLQRLKSVLFPLLVSAEARRKRLVGNAGKARETMSWLRTLKSTEID